MLSSSVILVSGACGLLGQQIVWEILEQNGYVLATDTNTDKATKLIQTLPSERVQFEPMDITDTGSIDQAIAVGVKQFGSVDACVNAAYPRTEAWGTPFEELKMDDLQENLRLQLGGAIILSQRMMKHFVSQTHGNFIHISSILGLAIPKFEHYEGTSMNSTIEYSAVKSGIISMTRWLAKYYKNKNIRVNCVSPGGIRRALTTNSAVDRETAIARSVNGSSSSSATCWNQGVDVRFACSCNTVGIRCHAAAIRPKVVAP